MKKILSILPFLIFSLVSKSQYPITQNIGNSSTLVQVPANGGFIANLINRNFTDTTAANATNIDYYSGAQIYTTSDSSLWWRYNGGWIKMSSATGGATGSFWNLTGNYMNTIPSGFGIGTNSNDNLPVKTGGVTIGVFPYGGFQRITDTSANKIIIWNSSTKLFGWANWNNGGGGSGVNITGGFGILNSPSSITDVGTVSLDSATAFPYLTLARVTASGNTTNSRIGLNASSPAARFNVNVTSIGTTQNDDYGIFLGTNTVATAGNHQSGAPLVLQANAYKSGTGAGSKNVRWRQSLVPYGSISGYGAIYKWAYSEDGGSTYTNYLALDRGSLTLSGGTGLYGSFNNIYMWADGGSNYFLGSAYYGTTTGALDNTMIGISTGSSLTVGINNVAVGNFALQNDTSGSNNTAIGRSSLNANKNGYSNTATGAASLRDNITGFQNVANGGGSLETNTIGQENTAAGYNSLQNNTTGIRNVGIGNNAKSSPNGLQNIMIGYYARAGNGTDSVANNVMIGAYAGNQSWQKTDVKGSIGIGYSVNTTKSNQAVFGSNAITETILRGDIIDSTLAYGYTGYTMRYNPSNGKFTYADTTSGGSGWGLTGNTGTNSGTNFLGTTDNVSLRFRTNNSERMVIDSTGNVGIGTSSPSRLLHVAGKSLFTDSLRYSLGASNGYLLTSDASGNATWISPLSLTLPYWATSGTTSTSNPVIDGVNSPITIMSASDAIVYWDNHVVNIGDPNNIATGTVLKIDPNASSIYATHSTNSLLFGVNTPSPTSTFHVQGSFATAIVDAGDDYSVLSTDRNINVTASGKTITLPDPTICAGREIAVFNSSSGTIMVESAAGHIGNYTTVSTWNIASDGANTFVSNGTDWKVK